MEPDEITRMTEHLKAVWDNMSPDEREAHTAEAIYWTDEFGRDWDNVDDVAAIILGMWDDGSTKGERRPETLRSAAAAYQHVLAVQAT